MTMAALGCAVLLGGLPVPPGAQAQTATQVAQAGDTAPAARRARPRVRIYRNDIRRNEDERGVYPRYNPGPNAVRDCTAHLVQEYRPSGTVIVPRMNCFWRPG